ncbi:MAG TPA: DUF2125 domain-containing protein [Microvirga sp.]|jgi:hypothetical protein|nr:DUF2125 domain-containing protein [Microvirga sp.]
MAETAGTTHHSRFWLYAPFVLLGLVAVAWTGAWTLIRGRVVEGADRWLAAEAQAGRQWTCQDRQVGGYPFRIEVSCASLTLQGDGVSGSLGRVHSVAQVYQPGHVITEIAGPMRFTDGRVNVEGTWRLLETSLRGSSRGFQRASLLAEGAQFQITGAAPEPLALSSERLEAHLRPNPSRAAERAFDAAVRASQARLPFVDALVGGGEPTNVQLDLTATEAEGFRGRPAVDEIERWRQANGKLDILQLSLAKGARRMEATGALRLDELRRPAGQLNVAAAGLDGLINNLTGNRVGGNLLGALLGQAPRPQGQAAGSNGLSNLPPFRIEDGRVLFGPFAVPNLRLPPLY